MSSRVIVVVDDLLFNRVILTRMLNQLGFSNVLCFESGAKLLNCSEEVGFILLDIVMPYLDGYGTARAFRALEQQQGRGARVPIVACSAEVDAADSCDGVVAAQCRIAGMDDCVGKPLSLQALAALLLKHTGDCGSLHGLPERLQVSSVTAQAVQARAAQQLSKASRASCAAKEAAPVRRHSLDGTWPELGRFHCGGLWDLDALLM